MFRNRIKYIIISLFCISSTIACSTKNVVKDIPKEQKQEVVQIEPSVQIQTCHYPEYCFDAAMKDYKDGKRSEAVSGFLAVAEGFPDTIWRKRSLFMIGRIYKEASDPRAVDYLKISAQEYRELQDYALYFLAEYYISKEYYTHAVENYDAAIKSFPNSPLISRAVYKKAEANLSANYLFLAKEGFNEFVKKFPENGLTANAVFKIGEAFEKEGNDVIAADYYKRILCEYPYHSLSKSADERFAGLKNKNSQIPDLTTDELLLRANNLYKYPLFDKAVTEYQRLIEALPAERHSEILQKLGVSLFKTGKTEDAIQIFNRMVNEAPSKNAGAEALLWLGKCYARLGYDDNLLNSYQAIFKRYSESEWMDDALFAAADFYSNKNDFKKAISYYKKLAEGFPESALSEQAYWYIGWLNYRLGNYKEAASSFNEFLFKYPQSEYINRVLYWRGRSLEKTGKAGSADALYQKVCKTRYGFYCYNVKSRNENLSDAGLVVNNADNGKAVQVNNGNNAIEADANFIRAKELSILGMNQDAVNELYKLRERVSLNKEGLLLINKMLYEFGEYHISVKSIIQNFYDKIERGGNDLPEYFWGLAYPQGYWSVVTEYAARYGLDPYLVASIMREESWFNKQAVSRSGARGVMQLMPFTARWVSKQLKYEYNDDENLFDAEININFGAWYLSYLKKRFNGNTVLIIASYNAGPEAVTKWVNGNSNMETDEFIEAIPYNETRAYAKRVLRSYAEYHRIYNNSAIRWGKAAAVNGGLN
ncbi:MAG: transglycosylase SLT domain-containing protein [Nitrospirota bacterium]